MAIDGLVGFIPLYVLASLLLLLVVKRGESLFAQEVFVRVMLSLIVCFSSDVFSRMLNLGKEQRLIEGLGYSAFTFVNLQFADNTLLFVLLIWSSLGI